MARSAYIIIGAILLFGAYLYGVTALSPVEPVGRLGFVKLANPDMYPGHPQSKVLASYAARGDPNAPSWSITPEVQTTGTTGRVT